MDITQAPKILVAAPIHRIGIDYLVEKGFLVNDQPKLPRKELLEIVHMYDALIVRTEPEVDKELIDAATRDPLGSFRVLGRAGIGLDNVDVAYAKEKGIQVFNTQGANAISAAEHTFGMMIALARHIPQATGATRQGRWERFRFVGTELYGKTLGVIGVGHVGRAVAERALAFGMKLITYDPYVTLLHPDDDDKIWIYGVGYLDLLIRGSDFITIHAPLKSETKNLLSRHEFAIMKKGVRIINCGRAQIVNQEALILALDNEHVSGYACDVYEEEPVTNANHPFYSRRNVICTPHLGGSTYEALERVSLMLAKKIHEALTNESGSGIL